jgi:multisubunit Na+/H+ antiporter MnhC subunit
MSIKGLLFIGLFGFCAVGALFLPQLGIYGYLADYAINPGNQWWGAPFYRLGLRGSFTLALCTLVGIALHHRKLKYGDKILYGQEWCLLIFLSVVWALTFLAPETVGRYTTTDHPSVKLTKIFIFCLMMTHVITDIKKISGLFWVLASTSLILGINAWDTPYRRFVSGRLEGIGGADFDEANFFAAFMAAMLPIIAIQFMRSKNWIEKIYALICGVFTANAIILCRSRGAFIGMAAGALASLWFAPKGLRIKIIALLLIGALGVIYLTDEFFIDRIMTITADQSSMDKSTTDRIELWKAGIKIFSRNPLGIGPGNWYQTIGRHAPEYEGKDSHSTFIKCAVELGILGIAFFLLLLVQGYLNLKRVVNGIGILSPEEAHDFRQYFFAMVIATVVLLACALTITMIYIEIVWVIIMLPICLRRAYANATLENRKMEEVEQPQY